MVGFLRTSCFQFAVCYDLRPTRVHPTWRFASAAPNSPDRFQAYVQSCHLGHLRKMKAKDGSDVRDRHKRQKTVTSSRVPISTWCRPKEGYLIMTTDSGNPCVAMNYDTKSGTGLRVRSVHSQPFLTPDARNLTQFAETMCSSVGPSVSATDSMENRGQTEVSGSDLNAGFTDEVERHSVSIKVDASLLRFVKGKGGATQRQVEEEVGVKIILPSSKEDTSIVIQGTSIENVNKAADKINDVLEEAIRSPLLDYSHFVSLPLAIHPDLVERLNNFQNSILGDSSPSQHGDVNVDSKADTSDNGNDRDSQLEDVDVAVKLEVKDDKEHVKVDIISPTKKSYARLTSVLSDLGIDHSIFIKPKTFHLTVLMLKLWNKERVAAATDVLQKVYPKALEALENRPISIKLKGLECMKGSPAKARVLYAPVEEIGEEGRLIRACQVIIEAYIEAGLVLEKDARQTLKLHATLMNARHRKGKMRSRRHDSFDARSIFKRYASEDWGEYLIQEVHLSQRFAFDESGYYHCCASIPFPGNIKLD